MEQLQIVHSKYCHHYLSEVDQDLLGCKRAALHLFLPDLMWESALLGVLHYYIDKIILFEELVELYYSRALEQGHKLHLLISGLTIRYGKSCEVDLLDSDQHIISGRVFVEAHCPSRSRTYVSYLLESFDPLLYFILSIWTRMFLFKIVTPLLNKSTLPSDYVGEPDWLNEVVQGSQL